MLLINEFTDNPIQSCSFPLETRESVDFRMYYLATQQGWYFDIKYQNFECNGNRLVLGANILRCFKNRIPFGLMVMADRGIEPYKLDDFTTGRVKVYVLSADEVKQIENTVFNVYN